MAHRGGPLPGADASADPVGSIAARLVNGTIGVLLIGACASALLAFVTGTPPLLFKLSLLIGCGGLIATRMILRGGQERLAGALLVIIGWLAVAADLPQHGTETIAVGGFVILLVIAGFTVGSLSTVVVAAASGLALAAITFGVVPVQTHAPTPVERFAHTCVQLTTAAFIVSWWARHTRRLVRDLAASQASQAQLLDQSPDAIVSTDSSGTIRYANARVETLVGKRAAELVGRSWTELGFRSCDDLKKLIAAPGSVPGAVELEVRHHEGQVRHVETRTVVLGGDRGFLFILRDVSDRHRAAARAALRDQILQSQRLEDVGRLTGGVAHDFNNLLAVIIATAEGAENAAPEQHRQSLADIREAALNGVTLARQLMMFSGRRTPAPQVLDLARAVEEICPLLSHVAGERISFSSRRADELPPVSVDPSHLNKILLNLAMNARDAMDRGGTLIVETRVVEPHLIEDRRVELVVRDTGRGMPAETVARIFDPFFTTKVDGSTGLGLSVVQGLVTAAGGTIRCESEPGKGTTFIVGFPAAPDAPEGAPRSIPSDPLRRRVLLIDDQLPVRRALVQMLQRAGMVVEDLASAVNVADIEARLKDADVLLTDVSMPGLTGVDLVEDLRARGCGTPVIFMSGNADQQQTRTARIGRATLLPKPFTLGGLEDAFLRVTRSAAPRA